MEKYGAQCVFTSEINKFAQQVYRANFSGEVAGDINQIDEQSIPSHDILCGGFPCQAFSTVGARNGFSDPRGTLFFEILRIAKYHLPKVILLENVKGLLTHNHGDTFLTIKNSLTDLGYTVYWQVLDATMFDLPQRRKRVFIVAVKDDIKFYFPTGQLTSLRLQDIMEMNVNANHFLSEARYNFILNKKKLNQCRYGYHLVGPNDFVFTLLNSKYEHNLIVDDTKPTGTFLNIKSKGGDTNQINQHHVRRLTPKEYMRLQGFPDDFKMPVSNKQAYRLLGNAVAVPVVEAVFEAIKQQAFC